MIRNSKHGFVKNKSCKTNIISFFDGVTSIVDSGAAIDVIYLDFIKAFHIVFHDLLRSKLGKYNLDEST